MERNPGTTPAEPAITDEVWKAVTTRRTGDYFDLDLFTGFDLGKPPPANAHEDLTALLGAAQGAVWSEGAEDDDYVLPELHDVTLWLIDDEDGGYLLVTLDQPYGPRLCSDVVTVDSFALKDKAADGHQRARHAIGEILRHRDELLTQFSNQIAAHVAAARADARGAGR